MTKGARILCLGLALAGCGKEPNTATSHHATGRRDPMLLKAEAHAKAPALAARPALARRADEIEATALLRKRLGKSSALTVGEQQVVAAAQARAPADGARGASPQEQLRQRLGSAHRGKIESTR